jgi:hypothetical protein
VISSNVTLWTVMFARFFDEDAAAELGPAANDYRSRRQEGRRQG